MGNLMVWGNDTYGQVSDAPDGDFKAITGGSINGLALRRNGSPVLWGRSVPPGGNPPPGLGAPAMPSALAAEKLRVIALGRDAGVVIRNNGTLAAWGRPASIESVPPGRYRAAAAAAVHAVAIANDGTLVAWGSDSFTPSAGGTPLTGLLNAPDGGPFTAVEASVLYSLALRDDGTLYGWGHPAQGVNVLAGWTPVPGNPGVVYRPGETYKAIAAGNVHALALRPDGTVEGWGAPSDAALEAPTHVQFKEVSAGWGFSIGLQTDGTLWGWGSVVSSPVAPPPWTFDSQGWIESGNTGHYRFPGKRFKTIAAAAFHIMAIEVGN